MPIYEYECKTCGTTFEKRQSFAAEPVADCPNGHSETRRLLSAPVIVFKGSGFYVNDSRPAKNGLADTSKKSNSTEAKSESTSATSSSKDKSGGAKKVKSET
jgi:putative FmdB family regulatory protein